MNEKILISYIIPAYNAADTLERAVESITHTCNMEKCEILIVENGSTDYTNTMRLWIILIRWKLSLKYLESTWISAETRLRLMA